MVVVGGALENRTMRLKSDNRLKASGFLSLVLVEGLYMHDGYMFVGGLGFSFVPSSLVRYYRLLAADCVQSDILNSTWSSSWSCDNPRSSS